MRINLRRGWFAPDGSLYTPAGNPHEFPSAWEGSLPSTATVAPADWVPKPEVEVKPKPKAEVK